MFELRYRDAMGRIGILHVKDQKVETPLLLPVVNPSFQQITAKEMQKMGFAGVITNAYLINKDASLRERALKKGVHKLIGFDGIVMTDSGSYQLYEYGSVNVGPEEIVEFQRDVGADIGVILDIPSAPDIDVEDAKMDVAETLKRAKESIPLKGDMLLCGTVQGSTYPELRERAAKEMGGLDFDIHPIGGVVPLMTDYRFKELAEVVMSAKMHLPPERPVHLFGCGHPMIFALACAMGCDIFDSAAYALYARDGRYITAGGTLKLIELREFPCSCTACSDSTPKEIMELDEEGRTDMLSRHNLYASLEEIKRVKQSIYEGSLLELVEKQARSHPNLLRALRHFLSHDIERFDPVTKHTAFFYSGPESLFRPEVGRHLLRLDEIEKGETLVLLPDTEKPYSKAYDTASTAEHHICIASPVFGIIPLEIAEVYPLGQHERPDELDIEQIGLMKKCTTEYAKEFKRVLVHKDLEFLGIEGETFEDVSEFKVDRRASKNVELKLRAIGDYQFGRGAGEALMHDIEARWARTGRIRRVYSIGELIATLRPSDGSIILATEGARRLLELPFPKNRVVVSKDAVEFVREGKSVFAGFVAGCDPQMRPYQEVIAVSEEDEFLATGRALLNSEEMRAFKRGVAVKIRHKAS